MAWHDKVVWAEGMFLRPAHFQQQARHVENLIEQRCRPLGEHAAGFTRLELDIALLRLGKLAIREAEGTLPDGTPFAIPSDDDAPPPIDIAAATDDQGLVHLALPVRRAFAPELSLVTDGNTRLVRHVAREIDVPDVHTGDAAEAATIQVARLNLALVVERARHGELVSLAVARIVERRDDGHVVLDENHVPPVQDLRASTVLDSHLRELQGLLRHRAEALAARVSAAGRGGLSEIADFLLLQLANRHEAAFAQLAGRGAVHPLELHAQAVQLAAELATFTRAGKRPPSLPPYRHHDLQSTFAPLLAELRRSLSMVFEQSAVPLPLEERKYGIRVGAIADRTLLQGAGFVLAARAAMSGEELRRAFPPQAKIGSVEQIRQLVNLQLPGVALRALPVAPRQLPYRDGFTYFELERSGDAWGALQQSGGFALHVSGDFPQLELELWAVRA